MSLLNEFVSMSKRAYTAAPVMQAVRRGGSLVDDLLSAVSRPRARMLSAAAAAPRHIQAVSPPPHPMVSKALSMEQNFHITGTIDDRGVAAAVVDLFDGKGSLIDNTSTRSASSVIDRMSR